MQSGSRWVCGQKTEHLCQVSHHLLAFRLKFSCLIICLWFPRRTHTGRPGDLTSLSILKDARLLFHTRQMPRGQRAPFSWLGWTGYGKWLVYQLDPHRVAQLPTGGMPSGCSALGAPSVLTLSREVTALSLTARGGAVGGLCPSAQDSVAKASCPGVSPCIPDRALPSFLLWFSPQPLELPSIMPPFSRWGKLRLWQLRSYGAGLLSPDLRFQSPRTVMVPAQCRLSMETLNSETLQHQEQTCPATE